MAAGGNNQRLTSPSCNPLRLAKHAANDRPNFHYCKTFIYELWSTDLVRKQTLFFICRCQSTQILKTVKSQKSSFDKMFKMVLLDLKCLKCRISFCIKHFTRSVVYNIFVATYLLRPPSKHRQRCLASAERKVVPPRVRGPLPPLLWVSGWNDPLCNFLCSTATSTVTFHPNTFTCRTSVWNRGSWNLPLSTPSSCLPL